MWVFWFGILLAFHIWAYCFISDYNDELYNIRHKIYGEEHQKIEKKIRFWWGLVIAVWVFVIIVITPGVVHSFKENFKVQNGEGVTNGTWSSELAAKTTEKPKKKVNYKPEVVTYKVITENKTTTNENENVQFQKDSIDYIKQYHRDEYDMCAKKVDITASDGVFAEQMRTCVKRLQ